MKEQSERSRKNIDLFFSFMKSERARNVPNGDIAFLPDDDPELVEQNLKSAERIVSEGRSVTLIKVSKGHPENHDYREFEVQEVLRPLGSSSSG